MVSSVDRAQYANPYTNQQRPIASELPCSDDTPVDNEDKNLLPNLLLLLLAELWSERLDCYFGVDMGVYHTTGTSPRVPVVPDGFLSLGVERKKGGKSRRSYVTWEERDIAPIFVLEMVSHQPGGEYTRKLDAYARLGVLYSAVYNPRFWQRDRHQPFEVYKLEGDRYRLQPSSDPYWMPEVGLGIGRYEGQVGGLRQEILTWFDARGNRHLSAAEREFDRAEQEEKRAAREFQRAEQERLAKEQERREKEQERRAKERLEAFLRSQGIDPDRLPD